MQPKNDKPIPDKPSLSKPNPGKPNPDKPNPGKSNPDKSDPGKSNPDKSDPGKSNPGKSDPGKSDPGKSNPDKSNPAKPRDDQPNPSKPTGEKAVPPKTGKTIPPKTEKTIPPKTEKTIPPKTEKTIPPKTENGAKPVQDEPVTARRKSVRMDPSMVLKESSSEIETLKSSKSLTTVAKEGKLGKDGKSAKEDRERSEKEMRMNSLKKIYSGKLFFPENRPLKAPSERIIVPESSSSSDLEIPEESKKTLSLVELVRQKSLKWTDRSTKRNKFHYWCAEFLGTATFIFVGCTGCIPDTFGDAPSKERRGMTMGFGMMIASMTFSHISHGHFNPVLTIASMVLKHLAVTNALVYLFAQFCGAFAGYGLSFVVQTTKQQEDYRKEFNVGVCSPQNDLPHSYQGLLVEFFISFVLCFFACVRWDQFRWWADSLSVMYGVVYFAITTATEDYTSAQMNPARSLATAVINGDYEDHWIYWVGPLTAAVIAPVLYRLFIPKDVFIGETQTIK